MAKWTDKQLKAIETKGCNILVAAAAGSGKTAVLVERIIEKITDKEHPVDVDRLVVVTFTKAAVAEMKQRIRTAIDELIEREPSNERLHAQLTLINNAQITTIDSFCLNIVRNYFTDIDIDPGFRIADEGEVRLLENDVMEELLEDYYQSNNQAFYDFIDAYGHGRDDSKVVDIILKVYSFARSYPWEEEWYDGVLKMYDIDSEEVFDENEAVKYLYEDIIASLSDYDSIYDNIERLCESSGGPVKYLPAIQSDHASIKMMLSSTDFSQLEKLVRLSSFEALSRARDENALEEKKTAVKALRNDYKAYIGKLKEKIFTGNTKNMYESINDNKPAIDMMLKLARDFSARMQKEKRERNIIDFNDMEHMALNVLVKRENGCSKFTAAADSLSEYYEEILIDEYQDSNMLQEAILSSISKGRRDEHNNNIYMVGDVKQSIYKFRLACPELFIEKYNSYKEDGSFVKIELQTNFRSRENVLETTNDVFFRLMNERYCGIKYDDAARLNTGFVYPDMADEAFVLGKRRKAVNFDNATTDIHIIDTGDLLKDNPDMDSKTVEALKIAEIIEDLVEVKDAKPVNMVYDKNVEGGYRPISYKDIVILTRSVTEWAKTIVDTLMGKGIPAHSDASEGFFGVTEIRNIISYLTVVDNPLQDIPMAAVMLSYFGNFSAEEFAKIRIKNKTKKLYEVLKEISEEENEPLNKKVVEFLKILDKYRVKAELMPIYDFLWQVLYETGYYYYVGTMPAGKRRQANLDILLERAAAFENTSYNGLFNFLRYVERMQKFEVDLGQAAVSGENDDIVNVMSIHKSKGLEFPVVIVAGMGKKLNLRDAAEELVIEQNLGIGTNVVNLDKRTKRPTIIKAAISRKLTRDSISEEMRVLYVAMTRAREKLIMLGTCKDSPKAVTDWETLSEEIIFQKEFSYAALAGVGSYFDMTMPVALMPKECNKGNFNVIIHKKTESVTEDTVEDIGTTDEDKQTEAVCISDENFEIPEYPYEINPDKKAKVTVSELKKQQYEEDFDNALMLHESLRSINENKETDTLVGNERGSAYHRVMECISYKAGYDVKSQLDDMLKVRKLTAAQAECIRISDIERFMASDIGKRTAAAYDTNSIWREQPFVFIDEEVSDDQLIQGIIDLYIVENGEIVVVDYKTDRVKSGKEGEEELVKRYKVQLDYYAKALEQLTGLKVKEKIIYSFTLGTQINL